MTTVAIFGCGSAGRRTFSHLRRRYKVAAFLDNNAQVHGTRLFGVPVCDPVAYDYRQISQVFISSMYSESILVQLLSLGVDPAKVQLAGDAMQTRNTAAFECAWPRLADCLAMMRRAFYIPFRLLRAR